MVSGKCALCGDVVNISDLSSQGVCERCTDAKEYVREGKIMGTNTMYQKILDQMSPYFEPGSRDLELDVIFITLAQVMREWDTNKRNSLAENNNARPLSKRSTGLHYYEVGYHGHGREASVLLSHVFDYSTEEFQKLILEVTPAIAQKHKTRYFDAIFQEVAHALCEKFGFQVVQPTMVSVDEWADITSKHSVGHRDEFAERLRQAYLSHEATDGASYKQDPAFLENAHRARAEYLQKHGVCEWSHSGHVWSSGCGHVSINSVQDHPAKFCQFCGKPRSIAP